jgi:hypothetical protein
MGWLWFLASHMYCSFRAATCEMQLRHIYSRTSYERCRPDPPEVDFALMSQRFGAPVQHSPYFIRLQGPHAAQRQVLRQSEPADSHTLEECDFQPHVGDQLPHLQADAEAQHQACMLP